MIQVKTAKIKSIVISDAIYLIKMCGNAIRIEEETPSESNELSKNETQVNFQDMNFMNFMSS